MGEDSPHKIAVFPQHPLCVTRSVARQLGRYDFRGANRYCIEHPLELVVAALAQVNALILADVHVSNPAGIIAWKVARMESLVGPFRIVPWGNVLAEDD